MDRTDFEPWKGKEVAKLLALVENQRRYYQDLLSALPVALAVLSTTRSVVSTNRAFRKAFGVRSDDLRGKNIEQILPSDPLIENIRSAMVSGTPQPPMQIEHGGKLWRVTILPLRDWDEEVGMEMLLVAEGGIAGAPAAAPQAALPDESATAASQRRQLEQMRITAERNSALQGLSARLAHDLNNPLMIISGYAEEILRPLAPSDPRRGELEEILAATERISNLTTQLLEFTRKQADAAESVDLAAVLSSLAEPSVEIRAAKAVWAKANRKQLEEILAALVAAVKDQRARVTITCDTAAIAEQVEGATLAPGNYARVILAIPGRGMDPVRRKAIFESFLHKETDEPVGAALARAYALVREWGGELGFESDPAQGSAFTMFLALAEAQMETARPKAPAAVAGSLRETVLVVDDEAGIRALIVKILARERYRVLEAGSVVEALAVATAHGGPIQLLLTDVMLPERDGRQLAAELLETQPGLKVVYISGFTDDDAVRAGAFPPGARFLQKPFTLGALMGTVREALDQ
jgi:two-component system, cell cycle sensor histidine kinase and response regulator CckA